MKFRSTRDKNLKVGFWQSIVQGMASDGGLLVPTEIKKLSEEKLSSKKWWSESKPADFTYACLRHFVPKEELSDETLLKFAHEAINFEIPLENVDDSNFVLRIDRGPTASFKDVAARVLGKLMNEYARRENKLINIVVATSGDTGVAIADAFGGETNVTVSVLYPDGGVSEIQEKQMIEVHNKYENEQVIPVRGNFDVCQDVAKLIQSARNLNNNNKGSEKILINQIKEKLGKTTTLSQVKKIKEIVGSIDISSANSINIWRLVPQMTQYFTAYGALVKSGKIKVGDKIVFSVPTGNVGHLMAGIYAREIGLPVSKFIVGTNTNNIFANIVGSGVVKHRPFKNSSAPSMDILDPSNLERLLDFFESKNNKNAKIDYEKMKRDIKNINPDHDGVSLSSYGVSNKTILNIKNLIWAEDTETDEEVYAMMKYVFDSDGVMLEPHGVIGYLAAIRARAKMIVEQGVPIVVFETAHPDKFNVSLVKSGLSGKKHYLHPVLNRLKKMNIKNMKKPVAQNADVLGILEKIYKLTNR